MYETLIKGGLVIDGGGEPARRLDIAIANGRIAEIASEIDPAKAREVVDARGKYVTPGFLDIHTHYDGQATWDTQLLPSSGHGVTTIVLGCCGVGFAPVRPGAEDWLVRLMEGVEDIPGTALHAGISWGWESFTDYLNVLERRAFAVDVAAQVPHSAVRAYVLGPKAELDEPASPEELAEMQRIVREGIAAGAVGFGTSRVVLHRASDGANVPGTKAAEDELLALAEAVREGGGGVFQLIPSGQSGGVENGEGEGTLAGLKFFDSWTMSQEVEMLRRLHARTGLPVTFTFGESAALGKREFLKVIDQITEITAAGEAIHPQYAPRGAGGLIALDAYHPFMARPSYRAIAELPVAERARRMAEPEVKTAILGETDIDPESDNPMLYFHQTLRKFLNDIYSLNEVDYEPEPGRSIAARAQAEGRDPLDLFYDLLVADEGAAVLIWMASSYVDGDLNRIADFLADEQFIVGLGDGGAHVQFICDASIPTFLLTHWGRDRRRGPIFPVEQLVRRLTRDPARLYGLDDRGEIAVGKRADINVIDFARLELGRPALVTDLPTGAKRFHQQTRGYELTMVAGEVVRRDDVDTGARPGRLVRRAHGEAQLMRPLAAVDG